MQSLSPDGGVGPSASLLKLGHGLYGTAYVGGDNGNGTVFTASHH